MRTKLIVSIAGVLLVSASPVFAQRAAPARGPARTAPAQAAQQRSILVGSKASKASEITRLGGQIRSMKSFVLDFHDPKFYSNEPGSTPPFQLHVVKGTKGTLRQIRGVNSADDFDRNGHAQFVVENLGANKTLKLNALLPTSGHAKEGGLTKRQTAQLYADRGEYRVIVTHAADEKSLASGHKETVEQIFPKGDLVKAQEIAIKMDKPGVYRVQWHPKATGIEGYWTGRTIDLIVK